MPGTHTKEDIILSPSALEPRKGPSLHCKDRVGCLTPRWVQCPQQDTHVCPVSQGHTAMTRSSNDHVGRSTHRVTARPSSPQSLDESHLPRAAPAHPQERQPGVHKPALLDGEGTRPQGCTDKQGEGLTTHSQSKPVSKL